MIRCYYSSLDDLVVFLVHSIHTWQLTKASSAAEVERRFHIDSEDVGAAGRGIDPRVDVVHCDDVVVNLAVEETMELLKVMFSG